MMVNKLLSTATGILVPILILIAPNVYASNLSDTQRYNDGYSNGAQAAATDSTYNPTCDPTGAYTSGGGHTAIYCNGWANGYAATWNTKHVVRQAAPISPVPVTNQSVGASPGPNPTCGKAMINGTITAFCAQPANVLLLCADGSTPDATGYCGTQTQSQSFVGTDFGDFSNLAKIPIIGGLIASKSMHTGILHNEQGVVISWSTICNKGQAFILQSCNTLIL